MKEIHSHAVMDAIPVLALLDKSLVLKTHAITHLKHAVMEATPTMKEIPSLAVMDAIPVLALLDR
jgi:hypothetical protein